MTINMNKKYNTRGGKNVRILCTDGGAALPVIGLIQGNLLGRWTLNGTHNQDGVPSALDLVEVHPYEGFKVDDPVMVSDDGEHWKRRFFAGVTALDKPTVWADGATSWSTSAFSEPQPWNFCRRPTEEEI